MNYREAWANGEIEAGTLVDEIEEQAREIERLQSLCDHNKLCAKVMSELSDDQEEELAALKAQPSVVALPERDALRDIVAQAIGGDAYDCTRVWSAWGVGTMSDDDFVPVVEQDDRLYEIADACLAEVARLNSSPVSAGEQLESSYQGDPRSPSELSLAGCNCVRFGEGNPHWPCKLHTPVSAGGVDERAAFETWYLGHFYMGDKQCGLEWLSTEPCGGYRHLHPAEQWIVWQARSALSAPSHGEQVREGWQLVPKTLPCEMHSAFWNAIPHGPTSGIRVQEAWAAMLAAAPSAGSQEQG